MRWSASVIDGFMIGSPRKMLDIVRSAERLKRDIFNMKGGSIRRSLLGSFLRFLAMICLSWSRLAER